MGEGAELAFEATYGGYWLADLLKADGHQLQLANPLAMLGMTNHRRVKTDWKDAKLLADVLRMVTLPEGWIAPPALLIPVSHQTRPIGLPRQRSDCREPIAGMHIQ